MTTGAPATGLQLRSLITAGGELQLSVVPVEVQAPADNEVVIRVEAAPINPSDLGLLLGAADMATARATSGAGGPGITADVPQHFMKAMAARVDQSMPVGNEGAGVVVQAGASDPAQALLGKAVAFLGDAYSQYRTVKVVECFPLPDGATPMQGASVFVNPLTALGMVETMRMEGYTALVHTAAASNLGQMLVKICLADGVGLVNIVRNPAQETLLRDLGAVHVCDSSQPDFKAALTDALEATGATLAFDAIGGGRMAGDILACMEVAINRKPAPYSRYGSTVPKQVYLYGLLDTSPTTFTRAFGMAWGMGGWLLPPFLQKIGREGVQRLRARVGAELHTTFASSYSREIALADALDPDILAAYNRRATGDKYLINPTR